MIFQSAWALGDALGLGELGWAIGEPPGEGDANWETEVVPHAWRTSANSTPANQNLCLPISVQNPAASKGVLGPEDLPLRLRLATPEACRSKLLSALLSCRVPTAAITTK